jgi:hypothetical protein
MSRCGVGKLEELVGKPRNKRSSSAVTRTARRRTHQDPGILPDPPKHPLPLDADGVKLLAVEYCLFHYPTLYTAGVPRSRLPLHAQNWVVPIVLASPSQGVMGEVGELCIDGRTGEVITATDRAKVVAAGEQLYRGRIDAPASTLRSRRR